MAEHPYEKGFIVRRLKRVADWLKRALPMGWFECVWPFSASGTEWYVIGWFVSGFVISVGVCSLYDCAAAVRWLAYLLAALVYLLALLRVPEIIARTTTVDFSDVISTPAIVGPGGDKLRRVDALVRADLCFELPLPSWG